MLIKCDVGGEIYLRQGDWLDWNRSLRSSVAPTLVWGNSAWNDWRAAVKHRSAGVLKFFHNYLQVNDVKTERRAICITAPTTTNINVDTAPPNYNEAIKMLSH
uniref:Retrotransposon protein n=1 Tax=Loa loa TaxID=7209 RepID=A0A1I7W034_LOALO